MRSGVARVDVDVPEREGSYGERALAVEPGGAEFIPLAERRGTPVQLLWTQMLEPLLFDTRYGPVAMAAGMGLSIWLFSNQTEYDGPIPNHVGSLGDLTFEVGFTITAITYLLWRGGDGRTALP